MIERIDTVCLKVSDIERSSQWYQEILGFEVAFQDKGYRVLKVGNGGVPLTIEEGLTTKNASQSYPIFFASNIEDTYEKLRSQGVKVDPLHNDGVNRFFDFLRLRWEQIAGMLF